MAVPVASVVAEVPGRLAVPAAEAATAAAVDLVPAEGLAGQQDPVGAGLARPAQAVQAGPGEPAGPAASPVVAGQVVPPMAPARTAAAGRTGSAAIRGPAALEVLVAPVALVRRALVALLDLPAVAAAPEATAGARKGAMPTT
jgi:hypothetical protein